VRRNSQWNNKEAPCLAHQRKAPVGNPEHFLPGVLVQTRLPLEDKLENDLHIRGVSAGKRDYSAPGQVILLQDGKTVGGHKAWVHDL